MYLLNVNIIEILSYIRFIKKNHLTFDELIVRY